MTKKKGIILSVISIFLILISTISVFGAYYGKGVFKDVFINREYYFTSNTLKRIEDVSDASNVSLSTKISVGSDTQNVSICNYNLGTGDFQNQDVTFTLYAWLEGESFTSDDRKYELTISGVDGKTELANSNIKAAGAALPEPISSNLELKGNKQSSVTVSIDYNLVQGEVVDDLPHIVLAAKVTSPKFMTNRILGGKFYVDKGSDFSKESADFVKAANTHTNAYGAFTYEIDCNGTPKASDKIVVKYNSDIITLDMQNMYYANISDLEDATEEEEAQGINKKIEITPSYNFKAKLVFYRNNSSNAWDDEAEKSASDSWTYLSSYIKTELVR